MVGELDFGLCDLQVVEDMKKDFSRAVEAMRHMPQLECPVTHIFSPGIYVREIFMPAGAIIVGYVHKTRHLNVVLTGRATVHMEGDTREIEAPMTFESGPGVQKVLLIHEDVLWQTIHHNPKDCRNVRKLEERLVKISPEDLKLKGNMTLDQFRHAVSQLQSPERRVIDCPSQS